PQKIARRACCGRKIGNVRTIVSLVNQFCAICAIGPESWPCADAVDLPFDNASQLVRGIKDLELETRRPRIDDQHYFHDITPPLRLFDAGRRHKSPPPRTRPAVFALNQRARS